MTPSRSAAARASASRAIPTPELLAASILLLASLGLVFHDLTNGNRPHELESLPLVFGLLSINLFLAWRMARSWIGARKQPTLPPRHLAKSLWAVCLTALSALIWLAAIWFLPTILAN